MRTHITRVLCPIDYSECSRRALEHATAIARWYEAELTVLYAVPLAVPATVVAGGAAVALPHESLDLEPSATTALHDFTAPARAAGVVPASAVVTGPVVPAIVDGAVDTRADLIVVGTHGRTGVARLFLGSVAEGVLREAPCPVMTVPSRAPRLPSGAALFTRILCPVSFTDASLAALESALALARAGDARLILLHALETLEDEPWAPSSFEVPEFRRQLHEDATQALAELLPADVRDWCHPEIRVVVGRAHHAILRTAEDEDVDLIVVGAHKRGALNRLVMGATAEHVVRAARCPVLAVRMPETA